MSAPKSRVLVGYVLRIGRGRYGRSWVKTADMATQLKLSAKLFANRDEALQFASATGWTHYAPVARYRKLRQSEPVAVAVEFGPPLRPRTDFEESEPCPDCAALRERAERAEAERDQLDAEWGAMADYLCEACGPNHGRGDPREHAEKLVAQRDTARADVERLTRERDAAEQRDAVARCAAAVREAYAKSSNGSPPNPSGPPRVGDECWVRGKIAGVRGDGTIDVVDTQNSFIIWSAKLGTDVVRCVVVQSVNDSYARLRAALERMDKGKVRR